jgi:hypothetical protein
MITTSGDHRHVTTPKPYMVTRPAKEPHHEDNHDLMYAHNHIQQSTQSRTSIKIRHTPL